MFLLSRHIFTWNIQKPTVESQNLLSLYWANEGAFEQKFNYCTFELLGAFPLSNVSLMTDEERARFLPAVRTFTSVLQKDYVDPEEMKILMAEAKKLHALLPQNLKGSINNAVSSAY